MDSRFKAKLCQVVKSISRTRYDNACLAPAMEAASKPEPATPFVRFYRCLVIIPVPMPVMHATPFHRLLAQTLRRRSSHSLPTAAQRIVSRIAQHTENRPLKLDHSIYLKFSTNELSDFYSAYQLLSADEKLSLALSLAETGIAGDLKLIKNLEFTLATLDQASQDGKPPKSIVPFRQKLQDMLMPAYRQLFLELGRLPRGVQLVVRMRADILEMMLSNDFHNKDRDYQNLKQLDAVLKDILLHWFSTGLLEVKRVTWHSSPSAMLERIAAGELVHPVRNWVDLKKRVESANRLCFAFTHPNLGDSEPIVSLFCALCPEVPRSVGQVIESRADHHDSASSSMKSDMPDGTDDITEQLPSEQTCAVFYSINALQAGLKGIELGSHLIKAVVRLLRHDMPQCSTFVTLSPIPGFRSWLLHQLNMVIAGQERQSAVIKQLFLNNEILQAIEAVAKNEITSSGSPALKDPPTPLEFIRDALRTNAWLSSEQLRSVLRKPLLLAAEHYLLREKHRTFALCPVAHFHLSNGAEVLQLNYLADTSAKRVNQSFGIMTNYHYVIAKPTADNRYSAERVLEENSANYLQNCVIAVSGEFKKRTFHEVAF